MILLALFLIVVALSIFTDTFFTSSNMLSVMRQISINTILALGMGLVLIIGGIDLSVGSVMALSGCLCVMMVNAGLPLGIALLITLGFGAFCGLINGLLASYTSIPPFIITLATLQCFRGAAYLLTRGKSIMCFDKYFSAIGTGHVGPIPILGIILIVYLCFTIVLLQKTRFGRRMYAIGGNKNAAIFSGINVKQITTTVYVITGIFSATAGIILASRVFSAQPTAGEGYEADAIAAAVLGGVSFNGGIGTAGGVVIGALIIGFMNNGLNMLHVHSYWQIITKGIVILIAVYLDTTRTLKRNHAKHNKIKKQGIGFFKIGNYSKTK
jgi:ribose transport system permease protein